MYWTSLKKYLFKKVFINALYKNCLLYTSLCNGSDHSLHKCSTTFWHMGTYFSVTGWCLSPCISCFWRPCGESDFCTDTFSTNTMNHTECRLLGSDRNKNTSSTVDTLSIVITSKHFVTIIISYLKMDTGTGHKTYIANAWRALRTFLHVVKCLSVLV